MKKNKNKGFVLLETLIVSTLIVSTLVYIYIQFRNVRNSYEVSFKYNTIPGIYMANEISEYLDDVGYSNLKIQINNDNSFIDITNSSAVNGNSEVYSQMIDSMNIKNVIFTAANSINLKNYLNSNNYDRVIFDDDFKDYIMKLPSSESSTSYRIIIHFDDDTYASVIVGANISDMIYWAYHFAYTTNENNEIEDVQQALDDLHTIFES